MITRRRTIDTAAVCPGCKQKISCTMDNKGDWYSECGGEGEGGCMAWIDGDRACEAAHDATISLMPRRTYLDDGDHHWFIDPAARDYSANEVVRTLVRDEHLADPATMALVLRGARELQRRRPEESALDCLATSLVWLFG